MLSIIEKFIISSTITLEEFKNLSEIVSENFEGIFKDNEKLYLFRKLGIPFITASKDYKKIIVDKNMVKIIEVDVIKEISEISIRILNINMNKKWYLDS